MSGLVTGLVLKYSPVEKLTELAVLIVLAECADDNGHGAFPSVATIAKRARQSDRNVQRVLRELEARELIRKAGTTAKGTAVWSIALPRMGDDSESPPANRGMTSESPGGDRAESPEPSYKPPEERPPQSPPAERGGQLEQLEQPVTEDQLATFAAAIAAVDVVDFKRHIWIDPIKLRAVDGDTWTIEAPDHVRTWVRDRYLPAIAAGFEAALGRPVEVRVHEPPPPSRRKPRQGRSASSRPAGGAMTDSRRRQATAAS